MIKDSTVDGDVMVSIPSVGIFPERRNLTPQIPGQADSLEIRIERPLRDERIRQGGEDVLRYFLAGSNVHHLDISVVYGVAEKENPEVWGFGVFVDAGAGEDDGAVGFYVDCERFHVYSFAVLTVR